MNVFINNEPQELVVTPDPDVVRRLMAIPISTLATMHYASRVKREQMEERVSKWTHNTHCNSYYVEVQLLRDITKVDEEIKLAIEGQP